MDFLKNLTTVFNPDEGFVEGASLTVRKLSDLRGCFANERAYEEALEGGDPIVYTVAMVEPAQGEGQLHYGVGKIMPGRIGDEYYLTKGHLHEWREAAEVYIGLKGRGVMLLEEERSGASMTFELAPNVVVYVPGFTKHRTVNVGREPLVYLGIYPAAAGHDYNAITGDNFRCVVVQREGVPVMMDRAEYLQALRQRR